MYIVVTKRRGKSGKRARVMGTVLMKSNSRTLADEHAKFLVSPQGFASEAWVLTLKQAQELHENLGRKLELAEQLKGKS